MVSALPEICGISGMGIATYPMEDVSEGTFVDGALEDADTMHYAIGESRSGRTAAPMSAGSIGQGSR